MRRFAFILTCWSVPAGILASGFVYLASIVS